MKRLGSEQRALLALAWVLYGVLVLRFYFFHEPGGPALMSEDPRTAAVSVFVTGEVERPGSYVLDQSADVSQAIESSGGPTHRADLSRLNLWAGLLDGSVLRVPARETGFETVISLNRSAARELAKIPGVGPTLAGRIVRSREEHGPFHEPQDLLRVSGIGEAKQKALLEHAIFD